MHVRTERSPPGLSVGGNDSPLAKPVTGICAGWRFTPNADGCTAFEAQPVESVDTCTDQIRHTEN